jgi:heat shock protein HtpX
MTLCGVLLGTIVMISWYVTRIMFWSGGSRRGSGDRGGKGQVILFLFGLILMILAPIFAQLIYYAISRKREYLADASSAQYTRYPEGLASALEKIGGSTAQLQSANKAMAPMYISTPFRKEGMSASDLTSTHPPISERIRILRSMSGGASYADYNNSYAKIHQGGRSVIPASALVGAGTVGLRAPGPESTAIEPEPSKHERTREVNDLMWRQNNYQIINCICGTKLKVPPNFNKPSIKCPRCGRINPVQ